MTAIWTTIWMKSTSDASASGSSNVTKAPAGAFSSLLLHRHKKTPRKSGAFWQERGYQAARFLATNSQLTRVQKVSMYFGRRLRKSM